MASTKLFGNRIPPACRYCGNAAKYIAAEDVCLCEKRGVVAGDYRCRSYIYDPLRREPARKAALKEYKEEEFSL